MPASEVGNNISVGMDVGQGFRPLMVMALIPTDSKEIEDSVEVEDRSSYDAKSGQLVEGVFSSSPSENPEGHGPKYYGIPVRTQNHLAK